MPGGDTQTHFKCSTMQNCRKIEGVALHFLFFFKFFLKSSKIKRKQIHVSKSRNLPLRFMWHRLQMLLTFLLQLSNWNGALPFSFSSAGSLQLPSPEENKTGDNRIIYKSCSWLGLPYATILHLPLHSILPCAKLLCIEAVVICCCCCC